MSAVLELLNDYALGIAYNRAGIEDLLDPAVRRAGLDGDAQALIIGARWFTDDWYVATSVSRLKNHETTDLLVYFDGWGWEVYAQYRLHDRIWVVGGWNYLKPDSGQATVDPYRVNYAALGLRYTFRDFERMLYTEIPLDESRNQDGSEPGNVYTIGIRWDLP